MLENVNELYTAPVKLKFDPKVLRLTSIKPGPLMAGDGQKINFTESTQNDIGRSHSHPQSSSGHRRSNGHGRYSDLTFQAIGRGTSPVAVTDAGVKNVQMQPIPVSAPSMTVVVQ